MSTEAIRKPEEEAAEGEWITLYKASKLLGESRELVTKRALRGEIAVLTAAHVVLYKESDVLALVEAKRA